MSFDERLRDGVRAEAGSFAPDVDRNLRSVRRQVDPGPRNTPWMVAAAAALVVVGVLILGVLPGGGPDRGSAPSPTQAPRPTPTDAGLAEALGGTAWAVTLTSADGSDAGREVAGMWLLRLGDASAIELVPPADFAMPEDAAALRGVYTIDDGHLVTNAFTRDFGATCAGAGSYAAEKVEGRLALSGTDTCRIRHVILATMPWTRADP